MQGRTHLVIGAALAAVILKPASVPLFAAGCCAAAAGGIICDLDADGSRANRGVAKAGALLFLLLVLLIFADLYAGYGLYDTLRSRAAGSTRMAAAFFFLFLCALGMVSPHRSMMHSITAGLLLTVCVRLIVPELTTYFAIGFASHLLLDLVNRKGIPLFYPLKKRFSLGLFRSDGLMSRLLFLTGSAALVILAFQFVQR